MKSPLLILLSMTMSIGLAHGSSLIVDTFDYSDGSLTTNSGGLWTAHSGAGAKSIQVSSGVVTLQQSTGSGEDVNRNTGLAMGTGDKWYAGFDVTVTGSSAPVYFAHFLEGSSIFQARTFVTTPTSTGDFTLGLGTGSSATSTWSTDLSFGVSYRVVVSYDYDSKISQLWVNPALETDPSISVTAGFSDEITSFAFRQASPTTANTQLIDNLSVATTFGEALVVPEPSTFALGGFGLLALLMARRRS
jgi:hypothetical protein